MSELFVDNSSMSVGESRDVAPFASDASADSLRRGDRLALEGGVWGRLFGEL